MRLLLYALQSSGASTVALTLAQRPGCVAFVDIWNNFAAPELDTDLDVVAKVVATTAYSLEVHRQRFKPDMTALILRHPVRNFESLARKGHVNEGGMINEKFRVMEQVLRHPQQFDLIFHYEDAVYAPATLIDSFSRLGWSLGYDAILHGRSGQAIRDYNLAALPIMAGRLKYDVGGYRGDTLAREPIRFPPAAGPTAHLPRMCPTFFERYERLLSARGAAWHAPPSRALLACDLIEMLLALIGPGTVPTQASKAGYTVELQNGGDDCLLSAEAIELRPAGHGSTTILRIAGLPSRPFNRICGIARGRHPCGAGTRLDLRVTSESGDALVSRTTTLSHAALAPFELRIPPHDGATIDLAIAVTLDSDRAASAEDGVCLQQIRLDHIAARPP